MDKQAKLALQGGYCGAAGAQKASAAEWKNHVLQRVVTKLHIGAVCVSGGLLC